ncbi:hypothetical protein ACO0QE_001176 [Hanseniaspora vineae]
MSMELVKKGTELETFVSENFAFKPVSSIQLLKPFEKVPFVQQNLLQINEKYLVCSCGDDNTVNVVETSKFREQIAKLDQDSEQQVSENSVEFDLSYPVNETVVYIGISNGHIIVVTEQSTLFLVPLENALDSASWDSKKFKFAGPETFGTITMCIVFSTSEILALYENNELYQVSLKNGSLNSKLFGKDITYIDTFLNNTLAYATTEGFFADGKSFKLDFTGDDDEEENKELCPISITFISKTKVLCCIGENVAADAEDVFYNYKTYVVDLNDLTFSETYDVTPAFATLLRKPCCYNLHLVNYIKDAPFVSVLANSSSSELSVVSVSEKEGTKVCVEQSVQESDRAILPMDENTDEDTTPVGMALDCWNREISLEKQLGEHAGEVDQNQYPLVYVLNNQGKLQIFAFLYANFEDININKAIEFMPQSSSNISSAEKSETINLPSISRDLSEREQQGAQNFFSGKEKAEQSTSAKPFGQTAFDQSSSGTPSFGASAFGQPAFGQSTSEAASKPSIFGQPPSGGLAFGQPALEGTSFGQPAFGQSGFGKLGNGEPLSGKSSAGDSTFGKPAFGQTDFGKPAFGQTDFGKPAFGQTDFGKPAFGQTDFGKPAFGQTDFGKPAFGQTDFGKSTFGQTDFGKSTFGQPAFGQTASASNKNSNFSFGGLVSTGSDENKTSFGGFGSFGNTNAGSPFAAQPAQENASPFANLTAKNETSPFGGLKFDESSQKGSFFMQNQSLSDSISEKPFGQNNNKDTMMKNSAFGNTKGPVFGDYNPPSTNSAGSDQKTSDVTDTLDFSFGNLSTSNDDNTDKEPLKTNEGQTEQRIEEDLSNSLKTTEIKDLNKEKSLQHPSGPSFTSFKEPSLFGTAQSNVKPAFSFGGSTSLVDNDSEKKSSFKFTEVKTDDFKSPAFDSPQDMNSKESSPFKSFLNFDKKSHPSQKFSFTNRSENNVVEMPFSSDSKEDGQADDGKTDIAETPEKSKAAREEDIKLAATETATVHDQINSSNEQDIKEKTEQTFTKETLDEIEQANKEGDKAVTDAANMKKENAADELKEESTKNTSVGDTQSETVHENDKVNGEDEQDVSEVNDNDGQDQSDAAASTVKPAKEIKNTDVGETENEGKSEETQNREKLTEETTSISLSVNQNDEPVFPSNAEESGEENVVPQPEGETVENGSDENEKLSDTQQPGIEKIPNESAAAADDDDNAAESQNENGQENDQTSHEKVISGQLENTTISDLSKDEDGWVNIDDTHDEDKADNSATTEAESVEVVPEVASKEIYSVSTEVSAPVKNMESLTEPIDVLSASVLAKAETSCAMAQTNPPLTKDEQILAFEGEEEYLNKVYVPVSLRKYYCADYVPSSGQQYETKILKVVASLVSVVENELIALGKNIEMFDNYFRDQVRPTYAKSVKCINPNYQWRMNECKKFLELIDFDSDLANLVELLSKVHKLKELVSDFDHTKLDEHFESLSQEKERVAYKTDSLSVTQLRIKLKLGQKTTDLTSKLEKVSDLIKVLKMYSLLEENGSADKVVKKYLSELPDRSFLLDEIQKLRVEIGELKSQKSGQLELHNSLDANSNKALAAKRNSAVVETAMKMNARRTLGGVLKNRVLETNKSFSSKFSTNV